MPTGYTAKVQSGEIDNLRDFALSCARAFGACITMKEESSDMEIPKYFLPDTEHYDEGISYANEILNTKWTKEQCEAEANKDYIKTLAYYANSLIEKEEWRKRYEKMLEEVEVWEVPENLTGLRNFMYEQLENSIAWDCDISYMEKPVKLSANEWLNEHIKVAERDLNYYTKERQKEIDRVWERNNWLASLRGCFEESEKDENG